MFSLPTWSDKETSTYFSPTPSLSANASIFDLDQPTGGKYFTLGKFRDEELFVGRGKKLLGRRQEHRHLVKCSANCDSSVGEKGNVRACGRKQTFSIERKRPPKTPWHI